MDLLVQIFHPSQVRVAWAGGDLLINKCITSTREEEKEPWERGWLAYEYLHITHQKYNQAVVFLTLSESRNNQTCFMVINNEKDTQPKQIS